MRHIRESNGWSRALCQGWWAGKGQNKIGAPAYRWQKSTSQTQRVHRTVKTYESVWTVKTYESARENAPGDYTIVNYYRRVRARARARAKLLQFKVILCVRKCSFNKRREYQLVERNFRGKTYLLRSTTVGNLSKASTSRCADNNYCERVGKYRQNYNWTKRRRARARQVAQKIETYVSTRRYVYKYI